MKARAIRSFVDKYSMKSISKGSEFEITEERFSELTAGPRGVFVEEIKESPPVEQPDNDNVISDEIPQGIVDEPGVEPPEENNDMDVNFDKLNKTQIVEHAKEKDIELNMEMTKNEMIEILLKK